MPNRDDLRIGLTALIAAPCSIFSSRQSLPSRMRAAKMF